MTLLKTLLVTTTLFISHVQAKTIVALSIDGGGIRGLIAAKVLEHIESRLKVPLAQVFDIMVGTSTGGIIVSLLNVPDEHIRPKYSAQDIVKLYKNFGNTVFNQSFWHHITTFNGWIGSKYNEKNLEKFLKKHLGNTKIGDTLSNVVIPTFDLVNFDTEFFTTRQGQKDESRNFYLRDLARATSAAPTYFPPFRLKEKKGDKIIEYTLVDGGVVINNPAISAYIEGINLFEEETDFLYVSIGTGDISQIDKQHAISYNSVANAGKVGWASHILDMIMEGASGLVEEQMPLFFPKRIPRSQCATIHPNYMRLQISIKAEDALMDNTSPENIKKLEKYAQQLIKNSEQKLNCLIAVLKEKLE